MIKGGVNENIIPTEVEIQGTIRAIDTKTYDIIVVRLGEILKGIVLISKAIILISFNLSYPSLFNNKIIHEYLLEPCEKVFGLANVSETPPMMGGEDFSFYSVEKPFMFYFLGANDGFNKYFIYNPEVVFDEKCIKYGSEFLCQAALSLMKKC